MRRTAASLLATVVVACGGGASTSPPDLADGRMPVAELAPAGNTKLDVLYVVDNSGANVFASALDFGADLAALFHHVGWSAGEPLDLHIGVISPDLGAGGYDIPSCGDGDGGRLRTEPVLSGCNPLPDRYIIDRPVAGGFERNYPSTLREALACIGTATIDGCGFEQPLEAVRRALDGSVSENAGFLRPDAALAVVILMDEDDCSVTDPSLFDPDRTDIGPFTSYRCFEHGVQCSPDDAATLGPRTDCVPRTPSPWFADVDDIARVVRGLKDDPSRIAVVSLIGDPDAVVVEQAEGGQRRLGSACDGETGSAAPAPRLGAFVRSFGSHGHIASACTDGMGYAASLADAGKVVRRMLGSACVNAAVADVDAATAGLQVDCVAERVTYEATSTSRDSIEPCDDPTSPSTTPCFALVEDASCVDAGGGGLRFEVHGAEPAPKSRLELRCRLP